jgi:predicted transcriptional regulator
MEWKTISEVADAAGVSRMVAYYRINPLVNLGFVERMVNGGGRGGPYRYRLRYRTTKPPA